MIVKTLRTLVSSSKKEMVEGGSKKRGAGASGRVPVLPSVSSDLIGRFFSSTINHGPTFRA